MDKSAAVPDENSSINYSENTDSDAVAPAGDFLIRRNGQIYAGVHLLIDFWGGNRLADVPFVESALRHAAESAFATVLHIHIHEFGGEGGVSGVAVLAESHISIHTWPELEYAAFDVFMCGTCRPENALAALEDRFRPSRKSVTEAKRGLLK
ncbi:MAG: adenosylmethionine decarboxylase [Pseudomonadota bacterium]|nr:adenosylmethionine decarboxylase [Pseudomonadota bacterium]